MKKTVSVVVPTYNEEDNIMLVYETVKRVFEEKLPDYQYLLQFIDNCSTDKSRELIRSLTEKDSHVQAIFNAKNFGFSRSRFYGLSQAVGDCVVLMDADLQDPPEMIPEFIKYWEQGYKVVAGIKTQSKENPIIYALRSCYYKIIKKMSDIDHIEHFHDFGLYDKEFIKVLRELKDPLPYLRGIVAELGFARKDVEYVQARRERGKTHFHFMSLFDLAMLGITSYTKVIMHLCTLFGAGVAGVSFIIALLTLINKLLHWNSYNYGSAALICGVFFLGALQLFFIGFVGEYIVNINTRVMNHPIVIEETRLNFDVNKE